MVFVFDIVILSDKYEQIMNFRTFIVDFHKLYETILKFLCIFTNRTSLTRLWPEFKSALSDIILTGFPASAFSSEYAQDPMLAPFIQDSAVGRNRPATSKYEEFRSMYFNPGVQSMVAGELSPADFCVQMEEAFNSLHE